MIVDVGNDQHDNKACEADQTLLAKPIHSIPILKLRRIGTGGIQHNQTKAHKEYDHREQIIIEIPFPVILKTIFSSHSNSPFRYPWYKL